MKIFVDCSDKRLFFVKKKLENLNYNIQNFDNERLSKILKGDFLILSPAYKWKKDEAEKLLNGVNIICGNVSEEINKIFNKKEINYFNLMSDEPFVLKNANLTAEGMLADLIFYTRKSIYNCNILILGGGRVAKAVALTFYKLGLTFALSMRNEENLTEALLITNNTIPWKEFKNKLNEYDVVINTIPVKLFDEEDLMKFKKSSVVFELASKQCLEGLTFKNFSYVLCPALPAKYSPEEAGNLVFDYTKKLLTGEK